MRVVWNSRLKCSGYLPKSFSAARDRALRFIARFVPRPKRRAQGHRWQFERSDLHPDLVILKKMRDCHAPKQRQSKEHHKDLPRSLEG